MKRIQPKFQIRRRGLLAGFRFLLWWGAESLRNWTSPPDMKREIRFCHSSAYGPIASWHWIKQTPYCLVCPDEAPGIRIVELPKMQLN